MAAVARHPPGGTRCERLLRQPRGFRRRVGVERGLGKRVVPEPEAEADHLAGVCLAGDRVGLRRLLRVTSGEPAVSKVEGVPEVVHGAGLPRELCRELLQHQRHLAEDSPVAVDLHGVVGRVFGVLGEGPCGVRQVERMGHGDVHPDTQDGQGVQGRAAERGHGLAVERKGHLGAVQRSGDQLVADEVEVDGERITVGPSHRTRGDATRGEVEGYVPPMVAPYAGGEPDLADDLCEPVQGLLAVSPFGERNRWEELHAPSFLRGAIDCAPIPAAPSLHDGWRRRMGHVGRDGRGAWQSVRGRREQAS